VGTRRLRIRRPDNCRRRFWYSTSTAPRSSPRMPVLGTSTKSSPAPLARLFRRKVSRKSRFSRFRTTAPPSRRPAASPSRSLSSPFSTASSEKSEPSTRMPSRNTRRYWAPFVRRSPGRKRCSPTAVARSPVSDGPSVGASSAPTARPWSASARESRGCGASCDCSAETSASSVPPQARGSARLIGP
jgi:hypothetical protein